MTDPTAEPGTVKRGLRDAPRWMLGLLIGSLAFNLLVLGLASGAMWHTRFGQGAGGGNLLGNLVAFSQTLPAARRSELGPLIGDSRPPELRALRQDVRAARREVMRQFTADPFDVAAFRAAAALAVKAENRMRETVDGLAAGLAKQLTAAERGAFLKWREHRRGRPRVDADDERSDKTKGPKAP